MAWGIANTLGIMHFVLSVRLLANMVAGHVVLGVVVAFVAAAWLTPFIYVVAPASILGATAVCLLELFVAFLQAYIFTILAVLGGQAVAEFVLKNLGNILEQSEIEKLSREGILGPKFLENDYIQSRCDGELKPKLNFTTEALRRDAWVNRIVEQVKFYLDVFGYAKL